MAADLAILPNKFKIDAKFGLEDLSIVQPGDTGIDFTIRLTPYPRKQFTVSWPVYSSDEIETFFEIYGRHTAFLIYGPRDRDNTFTNQNIRTDVSQTDTFQLVNSRQASGGSLTSIRAIKHPKSGTVVISWDSVVRTEHTDYTIDYNTGIVTFAGGHIPTSGHPVIASGNYYIPVRFDSATFQVNVRQAATANLFQETAEATLIEALDQ